jgi:calcineurin-like phosphoesterase family protein
MLIKPEDDVYLLGDLMLQDNIHGRECIEQLNGKLHIALGNHDSYNREQIYSTFSNVVEVNRLFLIKYRKWQFYCCHFPVLLDNFDEKRKLYCLHGHTHNPDRFQYINHCCYNVSPEAHNNLPVSLEQIVEEIRNKQFST